MVFHGIFFRTWEAFLWVDYKESVEDIITGSPYSSILEPLLFNIFIEDLFLFISNSHLNDYADDISLYSFGYKLKEIKNPLCFHFT